MTDISDIIVTQRVNGMLCNTDRQHAANLTELLLSQTKLFIDVPKYYKYNFSSYHIQIFPFIIIPQQ